MGPLQSPAHCHVVDVHAGTLVNGSRSQQRGGTGAQQVQALAFHQAWKPEFEPQSPRGGRKDVDFLQAVL